MIQTGKYLEGIIEMLNNFRTEVQTFSALGLANINKHSENFMKRVLNLAYNYELENLNEGKSNFPGLDLGDFGDGIAFQITSTKKSDKIDDTLDKCIKNKHYNTFKNINVFILTTKQTSYTLKILTEPHFTFSANKNILDFNDLYKDIEDIAPSRMKAMYEYIKVELQPTIESIRNCNEIEKRYLLNVTTGMKNCGMNTFYLWQSKVLVKNLRIAIPEIHSNLNIFLPSHLKNYCLPILNPALRKHTTSIEMLYLQEFVGSGITNRIYGNALLIEQSSLTTEKVLYSDHEIVVNLLPEMMMLLTKILFFSQKIKSNFIIEVSILLESNTKVYFDPRDSLVLSHVFNTFTLENQFEINETLTDVNTSTLVDLLQKIMYGFINQEPSILNNEPFLIIKRDSTEYEINRIKKALGITI